MIKVKINTIDWDTGGVEVEGLPESFELFISKHHTELSTSELFAEIENHCLETYGYGTHIWCMQYI